jgi:predicted RNA-binding Zn ribbon-like protein
MTTRTDRIPPAPRPRLSLGLVGTVRSRLGAAPRDDLADPASLETWLAAQGLATGPAPDEVDVREFRSLREAAYRLLEAVTGGGPPRPADLKLVNRHATAPAPAVELADTPGAGLVLRTGRPTPEQALGVIARDLADLLTGARRDRLRQCGAEVCGTFFLDGSRAGTRRWCSSGTCGNRVRVAQHRAG